MLSLITNAAEDKLLTERYCRRHDNAIDILVNKYWEELLLLSYKYSHDYELSSQLKEQIKFDLRKKTVGMQQRRIVFAREDNIPNAEKTLKELIKKLSLKNKEYAATIRKIRETSDEEYQEELANKYLMELEYDEMECTAKSLFDRKVFSETDYKIFLMKYREDKNKKICEEFGITDEEIRAIIQRIFRRLKSELLNK